MSYTPHGTAPGQSVIVNTASLPRFRAALAKVQAGVGNARVLVLGDSTTSGYQSSSTSEQTTNAYPAQMATWMNNNGIPARGDNFMGGSASPYRYQVSGQITAYTGGWTNSFNGDNSYISCIGGWMFCNSGSSGNFTITTTKAADTIKIWVWDNDSVVFGAAIDGGSIQNQTMTGTGGVVAKTISLGSVANHSVNLTWVSGSEIRIMGWEFYNSTLSEVQIINAGWQGSQSSDLAYSTFSCSPATAIPNINPDLVLINIGINDSLNGGTIANYTTNVQKIITNALSSGTTDVALLTFIPSSGTTTPSQALFTQAIYALAQTNGLLVIDLNARWNSYATSNALGLYGDTVHPNHQGYGDVARFIANIITNI